MGQYFMWLNPVKKEYMQPIDFDHGSKRRESSWVGCALLDALFTLMANEWRNDPIVWIGDDYSVLHNENNRTLKIVENICGAYPHDYAVEHFKNVACQFANCNKREIIEDFFHEDLLLNYGIDKNDISQYFEKCDDGEADSLYQCKYQDNYEDFAQFMIKYLERKGMFNRKVETYRLIINNTKKEYINTDIIIPNQNGYKYNPFPTLMIKEDDSNDPYKYPDNCYCGRWLGDSISVGIDDDILSGDYIDVSNKYIWENGY